MNHKDGYGKTALDVATNVEVKAQLLPEYSATRMLRAHVAFDCATTWALLGVRVVRGRSPRGLLRGWLASAAGEGETSTNTVCYQDFQE